MLHPIRPYNSRAINRLVNILCQAAAKIPGVVRVRFEPSKVSASRYLYIEHTDTGAPEDAETYKVRVSDHDAKDGDCDLYVWEDTPPHRAVEKLARLLGVEPPAGFGADVFEARSAAARRAALTRRARQLAREVEMLRVFARAIPTAPDRRRTTLCQLFRSLFPGTPDRVRIRLMDKATALVAQGRRVDGPPPDATPAAARKASATSMASS